MAFLLYSIHVLTSIFLILVVLLQQGKGADLSVFGGGSTMTAFGARGAASLLHKFTVGGFVVFILTTLAIGVYQTRQTDDVIRGLPSADEAATAASSEADEGEAEASVEGETDAGVTGVLPEADEPAMSSSGEEGGEAGEDEAPPPEDPGSTEESGN